MGEVSGKKIENLNEQISSDAEKYYDTYRDQMDLFDESLVAKTRKLHDADYWMLGKMLEQYDQFEAFVNEEDTSLGALGRIPTIAHDVIAVSMGQSIIPAVAAVQPIDDEQGLVYYRQVLAQDARGNLAANGVITDPRNNIVTPQSYASSQISGTQATATAALAFNLSPAPVRSGTLMGQLDSDPGNVFFQDVGPKAGDPPGVGCILGKGVSGTVNYSTGAVTLAFETDPGVDQISFTYQQDFEASPDIPIIKDFYDHKLIKARAFALKGTLGMLKSFALRKRFNINGSDALSRTLVESINAEIGGELIKVLVANSPNAGSPVQFDKTAPAGVSFFEHKQTLADKFSDVEAVMLGNAGRGSISAIVAGREVAAIIGTLPGFTKLSDGRQMGAHIYGTWNGMTIIRVNEQAILDSKIAVALWKADNPFEAPVVYTPYMPLATTDTLPLAPNPLGSMKAAAVMAGIDSMTANFSATLQMIIT